MVPDLAQIGYLLNQHQIIRACSVLSEGQLDAEPQSVTKGTIRRTLLHLVHSQLGYLSLLTRSVDERPDVAPTFAGLQESARISREGLLALVRGEQQPLNAQLQTRDGFYTKAWVVMLQVINYPTEHREQIKSSSLVVTPPNIDGWDYGEATNALIPMST